MTTKIPLRHRFLPQLLAVGLLLLASCGTPEAARHNRPAETDTRIRPNVLILTADDMTYNSLGVMGNPMEDITPNIDRLAEQGMLFTRGYVTTPVCGPSRESIFTGLYPENHGVMGHGMVPPEWWEDEHPDAAVTGLMEWVQEHGYFTGVIDKHVSRHSRVDYKKPPASTGIGRDPEKYYELTREFLATAADADKPFVLNVNAQDPHRAWAGSPEESTRWIEFMIDVFEKESGQTIPLHPNGKPWPEPRKTYSPEEVVVPSPYPDTPEFREWLAHYYGSVNRMDEVVGRTLDALNEHGADDTIVIFLSDHGLPWAYSKWSLYPHGTRTPIVVRWPGTVAPGQTDAYHLLSTVDVMPTLLDALDIPEPNPMDGESFLPLLTGNESARHRDMVFSSWNFMDRGHHGDPIFDSYRSDLYRDANQYRPMRALHGQRYVYVWNGWADGETTIPPVMGGKGSTPITLLSSLNEEEVGRLYPDPAERVDFYLYRTPEELYDVQRDPGCLNNLAEHPAYRPALVRFRAAMTATLEEHDDHEAINYQEFLHSKRR